jgi:Transposase zinc-binding domain
VPYRRPDRTLLYRTVQNHFATRRALSSDGLDGASPSAHVEREFRHYRDCGILAHGLAWVRRGQCGHEFLIAFFCKGRPVCAACITLRKEKTAAHQGTVEPSRKGTDVVLSDRAAHRTCD